MPTLYATSHDSIANVQVAEPNAFEEKGVFTSSMPFTCSPKKQESRLHQKKLTAWELGCEQLSVQFCKSSLYLTSMALESHSKIH